MCSSWRRTLAWLKLRHWLKTKKIKIIALIPPPQVPPNNFYISLSHLHHEDSPPFPPFLLIWWLPLKVLILSILQHDTAPLYKLENLKDDLCQTSSPSKKTWQLRAPAVSPGLKAHRGHHQFLFSRFILCYALLGQSRLPGKLIRH